MFEKIRDRDFFISTRDSKTWSWQGTVGCQRYVQGRWENTENTYVIVSLRDSYILRLRDILVKNIGKNKGKAQARQSLFTVSFTNHIECRECPNRNEITAAPEPFSNSGTFSVSAGRLQLRPRPKVYCSILGRSVGRRGLSVCPCFTFSYRQPRPPYNPYSAWVLHPAFQLHSQ